MSLLQARTVRHAAIPPQRAWPHTHSTQGGGGARRSAQRTRALIGKGLSSEERQGITEAGTCPGRPCTGKTILGGPGQRLQVGLHHHLQLRLRKQPHFPDDFVLSNRILQRDKRMAEKGFFVSRNLSLSPAETSERRKCLKKSPIFKVRRLEGGLAPDLPVQILAQVAHLTPSKDVSGVSIPFPKRSPEAPGTPSAASPSPTLRGQNLIFVAPSR